MNSFEKLRKTIDKVDITYQYAERRQSRTPQRTHPYKETNPQLTRISDSDQTHIHLKQIWEDKQTQYIRQMNRLTNQLERISKSWKFSQARNQELVREICTLEKSNQTLLEQIRNSKGTLTSSQDRERMYKEQIFRINKTVEQMGIDLNGQRHHKKNSVSQLNSLKNIINEKQKEWQQTKEGYECKINSLKEEAEERIKMLQFNIKQNSEDRRQMKHLIENMRKERETELSALRREMDLVKNNYFETLSQLKLEQHRHGSTSDKIQSLLRQIDCLKTTVRQLEDQVFKKVSIIKSLETKLEQSSVRIERLECDVLFERKNLKVKVVEIRDQTTELQLEMYKKQYRQLLQEKAILESIHQFQESGRSLQNRGTTEVQYEIISKQERSESSYTNQLGNLEQRNQLSVQSRGNYSTK